MKLAEALQALQQAPGADTQTLDIFLACGFTPLHLETFLKAHLQVRNPQRRVRVHTGLFGDLLGNLGRIEKSSADAVAVVVEWSDLDPRIGMRGLGGWGPSTHGDMLATARSRIARIVQTLARLSGRTPLALCLPTLPLPPISHTGGWQTGSFDAQLRECLGAFCSLVTPGSRVRLLSSQALDLQSPLAQRLDVRSELQSGFPYRVEHASRVAELLGRLVHPPAPKKGLITDLDQTMWCGILGDAGPEALSWDLEHHSQLHGLYQQLLNALGEAGVLVAVASKNDPALVEQALRRPDLVLSAERVFPREVHWGPKSRSVGRILDAWNVGADSVVFVDDSPLDLAEVGAAYPEVECLQFPTRDLEAAYQLLGRLRDLFAKETLSAEDSLRTDSLRRAASFRDDVGAAADSPDGFLEGVEGQLTLSFAKQPLDPRVYELINKTNQFSLNGRRYTEAAWQAHVERPDTFLLVAAYRDKYGPLGKVAVLAGHTNGPSLTVDTWVMSCRAFSRRIEHHCLQALFDRYAVEVICLDYQATPRNGPLREFLAEVSGGPVEAGFHLPRLTFARNCPRLFHRIGE